MRLAGRKTLSISEWVAGIGAVALAVAISKFVGVSQKWENSIVFTVLVFAGVVIVLRPAWGRRVFWSGLIAVFLFHCIVLAAVEQSLSPTSEGSPWHSYDRNRDAGGSSCCRCAMAQVDAG